MRRLSLDFAGCLSLALLLAFSTDAPGQDPEPETLRPGVAFTVSHPSAAGVSARHVATRLSWSWGEGSLDLRIPRAGFRIDARALLLVQAPGLHRFLVEGEGPTTIRIGGKLVGAEGVELRPGFQRIELSHQPRGRGTRLAVDWQGPEFSREPVPARLLYLLEEDHATPDAFEQGRALADRLGCANCHEGLGLPRHPELGPPLDASPRAIEPAWLAAWLTNPRGARPASRMPTLGTGLAARDVADLTAFLARNGREPGVTPEIRMALNVASPEKGRLAFRSLGCLACHAPPDVPGSDLADAGRKRSREALAAYLERPRGGKQPARHRADMRLNADDSAHLSAYLVAETARASLPRVAEAPKGDASRGRTLAARLRCVNCHAIDGAPEGEAAPRLRPGTPSGSGCLADRPTGASTPRFTLSVDEQRILRAFIQELPGESNPLAPSVLATDAMTRRNCLGCHARDAHGGAPLAPRLASFLAEDSALAGLKGTLNPPNLTAVGAKLRPDYLLRAVNGSAPVARPWLAVRMPAFRFEPGEAERIAASFRVRDVSLPSSSLSKATSTDSPEAEPGSRLIGQTGFGCVSCHVIAGRIPPGGEPETLGPDLALAHQRMGESYFRRWIADPQRILAGTPMPQFPKPVVAPGVPASLDTQLEAIWRLLGSPRLPTLAATGTREVARREGTRALVVRDMVLLPDAPDTEYTPRALAIGLRNDHTLLFDTDRLTWLAWWRGGFLYRTKSGRLWEWHPEGARLWTAPRRDSPIALGRPDGSILWPIEERERFGSFRFQEFRGDGLVIAYRLAFPGDVSIDVEERIDPTPEGWTRKVHVSGVPTGSAPRIAERLPSEFDASGVSRWRVGDVEVTLSISGVENARAGRGANATTWPMRRKADGVFEGRVELRTRVVDGGASRGPSR